MTKINWNRVNTLNSTASDEQYFQPLSFLMWGSKDYTLIIKN